MQKKHHSGRKLVYYLILFTIVLFVIYPIFFVLVNSVRFEDSEIFTYTQKLSLYTFLPKSFTINHYIRLFQGGFWIPLTNSIIVAAATVVCGFVVNGLAGFAFAKMDFAGKTILFSVFLFSFMIPFEVIAIPLYKTSGALGILHTRWALILPMVGNGMIVFLYRQFFMDIPDALIESARIDGAGILKIFFQLLVPLSKPVIISASLMIFIQQWDAFLWPLVAASSRNLKVVQVAISEFVGENFTDWTLIYSATSIAIIIPALLLLPLQKYYIQGVSNAGLKE
jgi:multiple sugar transport system permease protein/putative chitobiose transport system permease protein